MRATKELIQSRIKYLNSFNLGEYHTYGAYGGINLMDNNGNTVIAGFKSNRTFLDLLDIYIKAIERTKQHLILTNRWSD